MGPRAGDRGRRRDTSGRRGGADPGIGRQLPWAAWYPPAYWALSLLTVVRAAIPGLVRRPSGLSTWNVPRTRET